MFYFVCLIFLFLLFFSRTRTMSLLKRCRIPGPEPNLIFGNVLQMGNKSLVDFQRELLKTYGPIVGYYTGARPTIIMNDIDLIKNIQVNDFNLFTDRPHLDFNFIFYEREHAGTLLVSTGHRWKNTRKHMTPSFSSSKLKSMTPLIEESINTFVDIIRKNAEKGVEFNFFPLAERLTAEVIIKTAFGVENNIQINTKNQFFQDVHEFVSKPINMYLYLFVNCFPCTFPLIYHLKRVGIFSRACVVRIGRVLTEIIQQRKVNPSDEKNDILQTLINSNLYGKEKNQDRLTEDDIKANALHIYAAAYETTSITIANVAHHLVNNSEVQERVREEVQKLYESEGKLDFNGVFTGLKYLECVVKETLRLYPPVVAFISRECLQDYKYKDMIIPKGSTVMVPVHPLHYDPRYWPNPEIFDPMRFSQERKNEILPLTFQAFGDGPRHCIGVRFAYLQIKFLFAKLLLHYKLVMGPNTQTGKLKTEIKLITVCPGAVYVKAFKI